jgi:WD40 repeat protein
MRIAGDVVGQPGGLPLLQYALTEMVERRGSDLLTGVDYEAIGTVQGAVARRAEAIFTGLDEESRSVARILLLRLVTVDEDADDTRRRVRLSELEGLGTHQQTVEAVLEAFGAPRLLSFDRDPASRAPTVEVAHEALLREWGRLREWIEAEREDLILARRLRVAVAEWEGAGRVDSFLLTGDRLAPFRAWSGSGVLSRDEGDFLERSVVFDDRERESRRRRRRWGMAAMATAAVVGVALAIFAFSQSRRAEEQAALAEVAASEARTAEALAGARELAVAAIGVGEDDPQLAMLLALAALDRQPEGVDAPVELRNALRTAMREDRLERVIPISPADPTSAVTPFLRLVFAPDGSTVAVVDDHGSARQVFDPMWERLWALDDPSESILALAPGGEGMLVQSVDEVGADWGGSPATLAAQSLPEGAVAWSVEVDCAATLGAWSPDGGLVALGSANCEEGWLSVHDASSGRVVHEFQAMEGLAVRLEFLEGDDGLLLAVTDLAEGTKLYDAETFEPVAELSTWGAVSPDGQRLVVPEVPGVIQIATGEEIGQLSGHRPGGEGNGLRRSRASVITTQAAFFSPNGERLALANVSQGAHVPVWDGDSGPVELMIPAGFGADVGFLDDETLVTAGSDGLLKVWDLGERELGVYRAALPGQVFVQGARSSGTLGSVLVWEESEETNGPVEIRFDPATGRIGEPMPGGGSSGAAPAGAEGILYFAYDRELAVETGQLLGPVLWWSAQTGDVTAVAGCWPNEDGLCSDGLAPGEPSLETSVNGNEAAMLDADRRFRVWRDGPEPTDDVVLQFDGWGRLVGFSADWVVVQGEGGRYHVFDRGTGDQIDDFELDGRDWVVFDRADSTAVAGGRGMKTLAVISTETWDVDILTPDLGGGSALGMALSPAGDRVAVGTTDDHLRVFEMRSGRLLDAIPLGSFSAAAVVWLYESHIAAGGSGGEWVVFTLDTDELAASARARVKRSFTPNECSLYRLDCDD